LGSFEFKVFVGYFIIREGLDLFGPFHLPLNLNRRREVCASLFFKNLGENPHV